MIIKVCGMREAVNIREVESLGIDYLGMIFWDKSPRYVDSDITAKLPTVGVFVNNDKGFICERVFRNKLTCIQLHGNESPEYVAELRSQLPNDIKIFKAISIKEKDDVKRWRQYDGLVDMLLFDTKCKCVGGSGEQFDWSVLDNYDGTIPFLLSGGIGADDAERIKKFSHPQFAGIDLNSRFEIVPALKDINKLRKFLNDIK